MLVLLTLSAVAFAQDAGFDAHGFQLAPQDGDARDPLTVIRAGAFSAGDFGVAGVFDYADRLVTVQHVYADGTSDPPEVALGNVLALDLAAHYAFEKHVRLAISAPVYLAAHGRDGSDGASFGDLRIAPTFAALRPTDGGFGLAFTPTLDLPTGNAAALLGQAKSTLGARVDATYELSSLTFSGDLGVQMNPSISLGNLTGADSLIVGLAAGYLLTPDVGINLEARLTPSLRKNDVAGSASPAEILLSGRGRTSSGAHWLAGVGMGLDHAAGSPGFRAVIGGGFGKIHEEAAPEPVAATDTDGDGFLDDQDQCPTKPEKKNGWKDDDGCPDQLATVQLTTMVSDEIKGDIPVEIDGPAGFHQSLTSDWTPVVLKDLTPGEYRASAAIPGFDADIHQDIVEGQNAMIVELLSTTPAHLHVDALDRNGSPVDAKLTFRGFHATDQVWAVPASGGVDVDLRATQYTAFVYREGSDVFQAPLKLEPGKSYTLQATLGGQTVRLTTERIEISEQVHFATDEATIEGDSFGLLDQVAGVLVSHPEIKLVHVDGYTDDVGDDLHNFELSFERAQAVVDYLAAKGVERSRLVARGYGEAKPISTNDTDEGRAQNRRVEFRIVK